MKRHEFLGRVHADFEPRTYLEIGVDTGRSLALSRVPSIGIDPGYRVTSELRCDVQLARVTSDEFFARPEPTAHLGGLPVELGFVDGMHLFEYALRDIVDVERHAAPTSVLVVDDVLPPAPRDADRTRHRGFWTGDVYKLIPILHRYRPDLHVIPLDTEPTGLLLVLGLDPTNTVLGDNYDQIVVDFGVDDPQQVPEPILRRSCAADPSDVLAAPFWKRLVAARDGAGYDRADLAADLESALGLSALPRLGAWTPDPAGESKARESATVGRLIHRASANPALHAIGRRALGLLPNGWRRSIRRRVRR